MGYLVQFPLAEESQAGPDNRPSLPRGQGRQIAYYERLASWVSRNRSGAQIIRYGVRVVAHERQIMSSLRWRMSRAGSTCPNARSTSAIDIHLIAYLL